MCVFPGSAQRTGRAERSEDCSCGAVAIDLVRFEVVMRSLSKKFAYMCAGGAICGLLWLSPAFADDCDNINTSSAWKAGFDKLNAAYAKEDWSTALKHSRELEKICDQSPVLNYTIAQLHRKSGDNEKYVFYLTKATQNTERFALHKDMLDRIWSEKYVAAHPEAAPENIDALNARVKELEHALDEAGISYKEFANASVSKEKYFEDQASGYKSLMWTGTGIAIGGAVLAGVGAALVAMETTGDNKPVTFDGYVPGTYKIDARYTAGWALVGVGAAFAIAGAVFAGISGYKYKHANDTLTFSFNFAPNSALMSIDF